MVDVQGLVQWVEESWSQRGRNYTSFITGSEYCPYVYVIRYVLVRPLRTLVCVMYLTL